MANRSPWARTIVFVLLPFSTFSYIRLRSNHNNPQNTHCHVKGGKQVPLGQDPESQATAVRGCRQLIGKQHLEANINLNSINKIKINIMIKSRWQSVVKQVGWPWIREEKFPEAHRNKQNVPCTIEHVHVHIYKAFTFRSYCSISSCENALLPMIFFYQYLVGWIVLNVQHLDIQHWTMLCWRKTLLQREAWCS